MNFITRNLRYIAAASVAGVIGITAVGALGQETVSRDKSKSVKQEKSRTFCSSNNNWSEDRVSFSDLREMTIPATGAITVDGGKNGGVLVKGEERSDVLVRACVQTWGATETDARSLAANLRINTSGTIKAENVGDDNNWSVTYQIMVPRVTNVDLSAHNGGISISGVDGTAQFKTTNGGVNLNNVSGDVKGSTTNGGINVVLSGTTWRGSGLDVSTTNGGVRIGMPATYAAHVEMGTVNGGFKSDIPGLNVVRSEDDSVRGHGSRAVNISTDINGGGAPIRVKTTNGGFKISSADGQGEY